MSSGGNQTRLPSNYAEALIELSWLEKREVELLQRALQAEGEVEFLAKQLTNASRAHDQWRARWEQSQAQFARWVDAHGAAMKEKVLP